MAEHLTCLAGSRSARSGVACILALALSASSVHAGTNGGPLIAGPATVVDGDTLRIGPVTIRIHGIDAPEQDQHCGTKSGRAWNCGEAATRALADLVKGRSIECIPLDTDVYRRIVARCHVGGIDLGAELVDQGLAWSYRRYSDDYVDAERSAQMAASGIWQGVSQPAWDYRADRWMRAIAEAPGGCPIKGNISNRGERIYHTPWSPAYSKTRIDESKGEQWFCDEGEAIAAGWRAARWR